MDKEYKLRINIMETKNVFHSYGYSGGFLEAKFLEVTLGTLSSSEKMSRCACVHSYTGDEIFALS